MDKHCLSIGLIFFAARSFWPVYLNVGKQCDPVRHGSSIQELIRRLTKASRY